MRLTVLTTIVSFVASVLLSFEASAQVNVSTPVGLAEALRTARGGERIELAPGQYGALRLNARGGSPAFASTVTLVSADPQRPASFSSMELRFVRNIALENLDLKYNFSVGDKTNLRAFVISDSENVSISRSRFNGDTASGTSTPADGFGTATALLVERSRDVKIESNVFSTWHRGAIFHIIKDLIVRGNTMSNMRSDGMNFAQVSDVLIEDNYLHSFITSLETGDHPDMIQFWTNRTKEPSVNIVIRNNFLEMGNGRWTQSIFIHNEEVNQKRAGTEMFYRNFLIEGNVIRNAHVHGITVGETENLIIRRNTLMQAIDSPRPQHVTVPGINVAPAARQVTIENNIAPRIPYQGAEWTIRNNVLVQRNFPRAPNFYTNVFVDALETGVVTLDRLQLLPKGMISDTSVGSSLSYFKGLATSLRVVIFSKALAGERMAEQQLSIDGVYGPRGRVDEIKTVVWQLPDGKTKSGATVSHRFAQPGATRVSAVVTMQDGTQVKGERTIFID